MFRRNFKSSLLIVLLIIQNLSFVAFSFGAEIYSLKEAAQKFQGAFEQNDSAIIVEVIPPRLLTLIAVENKVDEDKLKTDLRLQVSRLLEAVSFSDIVLDYENASYRSLPSGDEYALLPTKAVFSLADGKRIYTSSMTLAFLEDQVWYFVRTDDQNQMRKFISAYPEFQDVEFPKAQLKLLNDKLDEQFYIDDNDIHTTQHSDE